LNEQVDTRNAPADTFARNIRNSQRIITGAFEEALADILDQFGSYAQSTSGPRVAAGDLTRRIGREIKRGLVGLPPNGYEFALWLWEVSPIHYVELPPDSVLRARGLVFYYLRILAAMISEDYVIHEPEREQEVIDLLDSSTSYVDARNLLRYSGIGARIKDQFGSRYHDLYAMASEGRPTRKLLPLIVCLDVAPAHPEFSDKLLALVQLCMSDVSDKKLGYAVFKALTAILWYGKIEDFTDFVVSRELEPDPAIRTMIAEVIATSDPALHTPDFRKRSLKVLEQWKEDDQCTIRNASIPRAIKRIKFES
jgi:hypothetical protein